MGKIRSCLTNMISFMDEVAGRIDRGERVEICCLGFQKNLDSTNHKLLEQKVKAFEVGGKANNWIAHRKGRALRMTVRECLSDRGFMYTGAPVGSILGPLFFPMYVSDLASVSENPFFILSTAPNHWEQQTG